MLLNIGASTHCYLNWSFLKHLTLFSKLMMLSDKMDWLKTMVYLASEYAFTDFEWKTKIYWCCQYKQISLLNCTAQETHLVRLNTHRFCDKNCSVINWCTTFSKFIPQQAACKIAQEGGLFIYYFSSLRMFLDSSYNFICLFYLSILLS